MMGQATAPTHGFDENTHTAQPPERQRHFTEESLFYQVIWIFTLGALAGFFVETVWCLIRFGRFEMRSGLVFGPFNPIYGIGACAMYLTLRRGRQMGKGNIFFIGVVVGSTVEYLCSYLQESAFGTVSWDYSGVPLNIGGRVCLLYSAFWGLLALLWVYAFQPVLGRIILRIPNTVGKRLTWLLVIFFLVDGIISIAAVSRWLLRMEGFAPPGSLSLWVDRVFHDSFMEYAYPNMLLMK